MSATAGHQGELLLKADQLPSQKERRARMLTVQRLGLSTVIEKGNRRGAEGFTADDVRCWLKVAGLITGDEAQQRALSWVGPWLKGLKHKGILASVCHPGTTVPMRRKSERSEAHGNAALVYVTTGA